MDNSTNNMNEKLFRYLDGELVGAEKENFEHELAMNKILQDELDSLKATREAVKMFGLQQKLSSIHRQMMQEMQVPVKKMNSTRRIFRYSIAVAASIVLIVGGMIGYKFYTLSSNKVFASNYHSYELSTLRDGDTLQVSMAEKAYREKDYKKVIELQAQNKQGGIKEFFLAAMSDLELGDNTGAIDNYKKVIAQNNAARTNLFKDEAEYYLALTYVRNKNYDLALDQLRNIRENSGHLYNKKVTAKLIRQVKMLKWR
jgi:hypothetical protein